jgi:hypothetical protein
MVDSVKPGLLAAYRVLMKPLVRILIRHGVSYGEFAEVLRSVFVEVAEHDFSIPGRRPAQSRIAILTGLTRKEIAEQKNKLRTNREAMQESHLNRVTRVLLGWHTDSDYTGPYGMPLELPFEARSGVSFTALVHKHSGDMAPQAMLDELLRIKAVEQVDKGWFKVLTRSYIPERLHADALERLGNVVSNFVNTVEFNLEKPKAGAGRFERIVYADDGLRRELLPAFDKLLRRKGQQLLEELDNWLNAQQPTENAKAKSWNRVRTGVGIYHFVEDLEQEHRSSAQEKIGSKNNE